MLIRIWVYDGILASGVAGPTDVFAAANHLAARGVAGGAPAGLKWSVESLDGAPVRSASGRSIAVDGKIDPRARADAILLTAPFVADMAAFIGNRTLVQALVEALRHQHAKGAWLATYCTGNFLLAEAGLLDGRYATTHWAQAGDFARRYPRVRLRADEILIEQDGLLCGGAVTSYLNLAIRLVEKLAGTPLASATAKTLLIETNRIGQASYATLLDERGHSDKLVAQAQHRMEATLAQGFRLPELAAHLAVSERTLNRRFKQALGSGPLDYLQTLRVEVAKRLLEQGQLSMEQTCQQVGYNDLSTFRSLFKRKTGLSLGDYQKRFRQVSVLDGG
ncbi:helix-turn-helix domain-containing protein [Pseudomonas sp. MPFS]|uniref:GlxA family transcriptional regulator n=1 Tax=Pseudomonas sp. MPFS TaxID=2795724 RepID=UPI001F13AFAD|nr:helix-turn-helix domain-containing protein [Pseudomonas sp. MPFS]UMZ14627.1 helix-turn-helix domain-containing protein [Pseudomonas sp. MPFS]